jgi:hypothetical protein
MRNPYTGWTLYRSESSNGVDPTGFWGSDGMPKDAEARTLFNGVKPSIFYIRASWQELEPSPGQYAWNNPNSALYKDIQGARAQGLQIALRVYVTDYPKAGQGTPNWIYYDPDSTEIGAAEPDHCINLSTNSIAACPATDPGTSMAVNPDYADPAFRKYFERFLDAFATYLNTDDPAANNDGPGSIAYVDAECLGRLGENNTPAIVQLGPKYTDSAGKSIITQEQINEMYGWANDAYKTAFTDSSSKDMAIPLALVQGKMQQYNTLIASGKYMPRMDHAGSSTWGGSAEVKMFAQATQKIPSVAEDTWGPDDGDNRANWMKSTLVDAVSMRANTLNLRSWEKWINKPDPDDASTWVPNTDATWWALNGGYRIYPSSVKTHTSITSGTAFPIESTWSNFGTGMLPSNLGQIKGKYRIAYALLNSNDSVAAVSVDASTNPADWVDSEAHHVQSTVKFDNITPGTYRLAVGIVDTTKQNKPTIKLAIKNPAQYKGNGEAPTETDPRWYRVGADTDTISVSAP